MFNVFDVFNARYRRIRARHNLPYQAVAGGLPVTSVVIPSVGADYSEEALLSATFAARFAPALTEIVIVTDQSAAAFPALPATKPASSRPVMTPAAAIILISKSISVALSKCRRRCKRAPTVF